MRPLLAPEEVVAAATAWVWWPPDARVEATDRYLLVMFPSHFGDRLHVFRTVGAVDDVLLDEVLAVARSWRDADGPQHLYWWVKLDAPPGLEELLQRSGPPQETLSVLARPGDVALPALAVPDDIEVRLVHDLQSARHSYEVEAAVFGGSVPDEGVLTATVEQCQAQDGPADLRFVAYADEEPVGSAGLALVDGVLRLWGGAVVERHRHRGAYRALLDTRLRWGAEHEARMALVKGRVQTSAPVLRRAGFAVYGEERGYLLAL